MLVDVSTREAIRAAIDAESLLGVLGFKIAHRGPHEVRAPCLLHGGDNRTAFRMRTDTKKFTCYSHGCELVEGRLENDIFSLVMRIKGVSFYEAVSFLATMVGINLDLYSPDQSEVMAALDQQSCNKYTQTVARLEERGSLLPEVSAGLLEKTLRGRTAYFDGVGVAPDVQQFFEVGGMVDDYGIQRATIPIRDHLGRLVSISARRTDGNEEPRYLLLRNFQKRRVLYNLHNALKAREAFSNCVIVVEGFKVVWKIHSLGFMNVVACMGVFLSEEQASLLAEAGFTHCILMFDGDKKGRLGMASAFEVARKYMKTVYIPLYELHPGKSPDDLEDGELLQLLSSGFIETVGG